MKLAIVSTIAIALAAPAFAQGMDNGPQFGGNSSATATGVGIASANQTQSQQANANSFSQGIGLGGEANNRNSVNVEGSVSASVGAAACTNGFGIGLPGVGAISFSASDRNCAIVREAQALQAMGYTNLAVSHLTQIDRIANTVRAVQGGGSAAVVSTSAPVAAPEPLYSFCGMEDGRAIVRVPAGLSEAETAQAQADCRDALN